MRGMATARSNSEEGERREVDTWRRGEKIPWNKKSGRRTLHIPKEEN
jgi:hypothetical protein